MLLYRVFCMRCFEMPNVITWVILSKKSYINTWLIISCYIAVQYCTVSALMHYLHVTSTTGKRYSLIPCTCFCPQALRVRSPNLTLLLTGPVKGNVYWQMSQAEKNTCNKSQSLVTIYGKIVRLSGRP
jgi:hypothetical protein